jgi:hypothetical protein
VGQHVGHPGPGEGIEEEQAGDDHERRPQYAPGGLQQQGHAAPGDDQVLGRGPSGAVGQFLVVDEQIGGAEGGQCRQQPVHGRHPGGGRRAQIGPGHGQDDGADQSEYAGAREFR